MTMSSDKGLIAMELSLEPRVADVMVRPIVEVHPDDTLVDVARMLDAEGVGAVVVRGARPAGQRGHRPLGIVSERDLVTAVAAGMLPARTHAEEVMTAELETARPDEPLLDIVDRMVDDEVRHVPVVENGVVIGMLCARDALAALAGGARVAGGSRVRLDVADDTVQTRRQPNVDGDERTSALGDGHPVHRDAVSDTAVVDLGVELIDDLDGVD